jgi:hypothetical protein
VNQAEKALDVVSGPGIVLYQGAFHPHPARNIVQVVAHLFSFPPSFLSYRPLPLQIQPFVFCGEYKDEMLQFDDRRVTIPLNWQGLSRWASLGVLESRGCGESLEWPKTGLLAGRTGAFL